MIGSGLVGGEGGGFEEIRATYAWVDKTTRCKASEHEEENPVRT